MGKEIRFGEKYICLKCIDKEGKNVENMVRAMKERKKPKDMTREEMVEKMNHAVNDDNIPEYRRWEKRVKLEYMM